MTTLSFERGVGLAGWQIELARNVEMLIELARTTRRGNRWVIDDDEIASRLATIRAEVKALRAMTYILVSKVARGTAGAEGTVVGLHFAELAKRFHRLSLDVLGLDAIERRPEEGD
ncbi:hypothetical protein GCM10011534_42960 [Pseudooceanicola nanhaiensis]|jgi:alkylation response protein AidB-like acyl-CoA dehydrogenase|uniref:Acyl-CoA dehydrogenase/oxidase C-terminal domain-containing protein n=1 Tax=Pseudooceanicola nanhaiensis TaxID=375761 RepID=A0A917WN58_9RHOB|nr:hypothetical protein GCM10011534_42960 [Pseudooceanicola nanhaiensis]